MDSTPDQRRRIHSIPEVCNLLNGISRSKLYEEVSAKRIRLVKIGTRSGVTDDEVGRYIALLEKEAEAKSGATT